MIGEGESIKEGTLVSKEALVESLEPLKELLVEASPIAVKIGAPLNGDGGKNNLYPNEVSNLHALVSQSRYAEEIPKENFVPNLFARYSKPAGNLHLRIEWAGHTYALRYNPGDGSMSLVLVYEGKTRGEMINAGVAPEDFRVISYLCNVYSGRYL